MILDYRRYVYRIFQKNQGVTAKNINKKMWITIHKWVYYTHKNQRQKYIKNETPLIILAACLCSRLDF